MRRRPFADQPVYDLAAPWTASDSWPARWIHPDEGWKLPWVAIFRCKFELESRFQDHLHVTADERYELFLDGKWIGRGSERGDRGEWFYESYSIDLPAGAHVLTAKVWALGRLAPWAQISIRPGFLCTPENPLLVEKIATGKAAWEVLRLEGYHFTSGEEQIGEHLGGGPYEKLDYRLRSDLDSLRWEEVSKGKPGNDGFHLYTLKAIPWLCPGTLPPQVQKDWTSFPVVVAETEEKKAAWRALLQQDHGLIIPAHTRETVYLDLGNYVCGYPELRWSEGEGTRVTIGWAESLRGKDLRRIRNLELRDWSFVSPKDELISGGGAGQSWQPLWWRSGRFLEVMIETAEAAFAVEKLVIRETRYPLELESGWLVPDGSWNSLFQICLRSLQMCAHETYMDCPYYEQLMYVGDTRIQCLLTYVLTRDDRLSCKAIRLLDSSRRNPSGWITDAYPSDGGKIIPPFSLWWVGMVHDYARWRGNQEFVRECLPGARAIIEKCHQLGGVDGVLRMPRGWNFIDSTYPGGVPPGGHPGERNATFQLQYILALEQAAELEGYAGELELQQLQVRRRTQAIQSLRETFWDNSRRIFADTPALDSYSEQPQCLALLGGFLTLDEMDGLWSFLEQNREATRVSAYFMHYLFEACWLSSKKDFFLKRLQPWFACLEDGFKTTPETFGSSRSECHAWSAHPLYHYFTGILGIRPAGFGFSEVEICPQFPRESGCEGKMVHPQGLIEIEARRIHEGWELDVSLPGTLSGRLIHKGTAHSLHPGTQRLRVLA